MPQTSIVPSAERTASRLFGGIDNWGFKLSDFVADELVNLGVREMPEPHKFRMPKCRCIVFR